MKRESRLSLEVDPWGIPTVISLLIFLSVINEVV